MTVEGNPSKVRCINVVGCSRNGISRETLESLKEAHRILYRSGMPLSEAMAQLEQSGPVSEVHELIEFLRYSGKGRQGRGREALRK
jgi:UDP-N-acetylglucosamine acyltransferase